MFCLDEDALGEGRIEKFNWFAADSHCAGMAALIPAEVSYVPIAPCCVSHKVIVCQPPISANPLISCYARQYEISWSDRNDLLPRRDVHMPQWTHNSIQFKQRRRRDDQKLKQEEE